MSNAKRLKRDKKQLVQIPKTIIITKNTPEVNIKLKSLKTRLQKFEYDIKNPLDFLYEECCELRRLVQLNTEEKIAHIKESNDFDANTDENELNIELRNIINNIQKLNNSMIDKIDKYELESNDSLKELIKLDLLKPVEMYLNELINFISTNNIDITKLYMANLKLDDLIKIFKQTIFNDNIMEFILDESSSYLYFKQSINLNQFKQIDLNKILKDNKIDGYNFKCEIFSNKYLISYGFKYKQTGLFLYDPTSDQIVANAILDYPFINNFKIVNNSIAINGSADYTSNNNCLIILNELLEIKSEKSIKHHFLIGANEEGLYLKADEVIDSPCRKLDWNLNELDSKLKFQQKDSKNKFYIPFKSEHYSIRQLEYRNKHYYVRPGSNIMLVNSSDCILVFDEDGNLIKSTQIDGEFKLDSNNNIVVFCDDKLKYIDANGEPFKEVDLAGLNNYMIDNNDNIHLYDKFELKIYFE